MRRLCALTAVMLLGAALPATAGAAKKPVKFPAPDVAKWAFDAPATPDPVGEFRRAQKISAARGTYYVKPTSGIFRVLGAARGTMKMGSVTMLTSAGVSGPSQNPPWSVSFQTTAKLFELVTITSGGSLRVRVNGRVSRTITTPFSDKNPFGKVRVKFRTSRPRNIVVEMDGRTLFGGVVFHGNTRGVQRDRNKYGTRAIFLGDSNTAGFGAKATFDSYVQKTAHKMGWADAWASGSAATGYYAATDGRLNFVQRAEADVVRFNPQLVIVTGGIIDASFTPTEIGPSADQLFKLLRLRLPNARIVATGPLAAYGLYKLEHLLILLGRDSIKNAAEANGVAFVDNIGEQWITGNGTVAAPNGSGNADLYTDPDGLHFSPAGHEYLATRLAENLRRLGLK